MRQAFRAIDIFREKELSLAESSGLSSSLKTLFKEVLLGRLDDLPVVPSSSPFSICLSSDLGAVVSPSAPSAAWHLLERAAEQVKQLLRQLESIKYIV